MITEQDLKRFENQVASDKMDAFKSLLALYGKQRTVVESLKRELNGYKKSLEEYAEQSHYRVDWDNLTVKPFPVIGNCMNCTKKNVGVIRYSDFKDGYMVCEHCFDRLCNEFDEEMS